MEMLGVSLFVNLKVLIISPHNLGEDLVECLGKIFISIFASHQLKPILPFCHRTDTHFLFFSFEFLLEKSANILGQFILFGQILLHWAAVILKGLMEF